MLTRWNALALLALIFAFGCGEEVAEAEPVVEEPVVRERNYDDIPNEFSMARMIGDDYVHDGGGGESQDGDEDQGDAEDESDADDQDGSD